MIWIGTPAQTSAKAWVWVAAFALLTQHAAAQHADLAQDGRSQDCTQHTIFKENDAWQGSDKGDGVEQYVYDSVNLAGCERVAIDLAGDAAGFGEPGVLALAAALATNTEVESVKISGVKVGLVAAQALASGLSTPTTAVTELDLSDCSMEAEAVVAIAEMVAHNQRITSLGLANNNAMDVGVIAIAVALESNAQLTHLDLSYNGFGTNGYQALARAFDGGTPIRALSIAGNKDGDDGAVQIAESLLRNVVLGHLDLSGCGVGRKGAEALAAMLEKNRALTFVGLAKNNLRDDGAAALGGAIQHNKDLQTLLLGANKIGEKGATALAEALGRNPRSVLHTLDLAGNGSPGRAFGQLAAATRANLQRHQRKLDELAQADAERDARPRDQDVKAWLNQVGLPGYYDLFHEHHLSYDVLHTLKEEDLLDIGIAELGPRQKILASLPAAHHEL